MTGRAAYAPGPATGADVLKNGDVWTLVLVRELRHSPERVWRALTDPAELGEWAPFDADHNLGDVGPVKLTTVAAPEKVSESRVTRAEPPHVLEYGWGANDMRWLLEPVADGTRLTLWHSIGRQYVAMGAAGWHICFDVLARLLGGDPIGRIVGGGATRFQWKRLNKEYSAQFGITPKHPPTTT